MTMSALLKKPMAALEGKFVPSVWWGRGVRALAYLRRKPVTVQSPAPPKGRWSPPKDLRPAAPRKADIRRLNRLGRRAKLSGMRDSDLSAPSRRSSVVVRRPSATPQQPHAIPRGSEDNVP